MDFGDVLLMFKDQIGTVFGVGGATSGGFAWWSVKQNKEDIVRLYSKVNEVDKDFEEHRLYAANNYAKMDHIDKLTERLESKLDKIFEKLDTKADK